MKRLHKILQAACKHIDRADILMGLGFCALCYGLYLAWKPLAFIVGGLLLLASAFFLCRNDGKPETY